VAVARTGADETEAVHLYGLNPPTAGTTLPLWQTDTGLKWIKAYGVLVRRLYQETNHYVSEYVANPFFSLGAQPLTLVDLRQEPMDLATDPLILALLSDSPVTPPALTGTADDYAPTGIDTATAINLSSTLAVSVTGISIDEGAPTSQRRQLVVRNVGAFDITLEGEHTGSVAGHRFLGSDIVLAPGDIVYLQYGGQRWTNQAFSGAYTHTFLVSVNSTNGTTVSSVTLERNSKDITATYSGPTTTDITAGAVGPTFDCYYLAAGPNLYKLTDPTTDTFEPVASVPFGVYWLVCDPADPLLLYAAGEGSGFARSEDGGETWTSLPSAIPDDFRVSGLYAPEPGKVLVSFISTDIILRMPVGVDVNAPALGYVTDFTVHTWRFSDDRGDTWEVKTNPTQVTSAIAPFANNGSTSIYQHLVSPPPQPVYATPYNCLVYHNINLVYRSSDATPATRMDIASRETFSMFQGQIHVQHLLNTGQDACGVSALDVLLSPHESNDHRRRCTFEIDLALMRDEPPEYD
jgi:hypothetical protein